MKITGAEAIIKILELENTTHIFGYPGATICPFYDALLDSKIKHILTRHEQGAAHSASGYARATGKVGVCVATSGPGATNLITGIATAYMDSIPVVALTGQVPTHLIGRDVFQEADITGATAPFCKHNYLVKDIEELPKILKEAFHIASTGRPGPVLVDIPIDIQLKELKFEVPTNPDIKGYKPSYKGHPLQIKKIIELLEKSQKPAICAGGGIISGNAGSLLRKLVDRCNIPVVTTLMGIGSVPTDHKLCFGMLGSHGSYMANYVINNADLLIIAGARVGDRAMASAGEAYKRAKIVHIDIDPAEIGKNIGVNIPVVGHISSILTDLLQVSARGNTDGWISELMMRRQEHENKLNISSNIGVPDKIYTSHKRGTPHKTDTPHKIDKLDEINKSCPVTPAYLLRVLSDTLKNLDNLDSPDILNSSSILDSSSMLNSPDMLGSLNTLNSSDIIDGSTNNIYKINTQGSDINTQRSNIVESHDIVESGDFIITTEVGQNQIWAANNLTIRNPRQFISSGGMGTMGYGLPAAIGAKIGCPNKKVINISGDGSFQMSLQELGTIKQESLGVKIIILNNSRLGMVKELQKANYSCRYSQVNLDSNPDFLKLAAAYGIKGERITKNDEVKEALKRMLSDDEPYLIECIINPDESTL